MNKRHLLFVVILSAVYYYFFSLITSEFISLELISFLCAIMGVAKSRNYSKSANYLLLGFISGILSFITDVKFMVDNVLSIEVLLIGSLTIFCAMMCYMIFIDETDNYRLNLKHSKLTLISYTGVALFLYLLAF